MFTNTRSLKAQIEITERELAKLKARLEEAESPYGADTFSDGTVLRFRMRYDWGGKEYTFAVIKTGHGWYPSGTLGTSGRGGRTWKRLCDDWKTYGVGPANIDVLTNYTSLASYQNPPC